MQLRYDSQHTVILLGVRYDSQHTVILPGVRYDSQHEIENILHSAGITEEDKGIMND